MPPQDVSESITDARIVGISGRLRAVSWLLEAGLFLVVAGSALAFGAVHPWAYIPVWYACLVMGVLTGYRALLVLSLRRLLGRRTISIHGRSVSIVLDGRQPQPETGWTFHLDSPLMPRAPLLLPGLVFLGWVVIQLVPLPPEIISLVSPGNAAPSPPAASRWRPLTFAAPDTLRGLAFLGSALLLHVVAATILERRDAGKRFRRRVTELGFALAAVGLAQLASGTQRIYGFFEPLEGGASIFGPFVNRNHFAGYMLLVIPVVLSALARSYERYAWRVGERPNLRRRLVGLQTPEGTALIQGFIPALAAVAALFATASRGALLAFGFGLGLAAVAVRKRGGAPLRGPALVFAALALAWFGVALGSLGLERVQERFSEAAGDSLRRTVVWRDSLGRMHGRWLTGSGFNAFAASTTRATPWILPRGATPWPEELDPSTSPGPRGGFRIPAGLPGYPWYREAHNDYLELLVETGIPGLLVALWGALTALRAVSGDPWLQAALTGVLLHEFVDFDLQIPAIGALFVTLAALRVDARREGTSQARDSDPTEAL